MQTFEQWWNEIEGYGLRAERFTTPGEAAKAAWDQALSLHAQADARPVAFRVRAHADEKWVCVDDMKGAESFEKLGWEVEPLYTHPEASAPGLSGSELYALMVEHCDGNGFQVEPEVIDSIANHVAATVAGEAKNEAAAESLTRASAATVAEPSELEMHRADYQAIRAAGFHDPGELLDAYKKLQAAQQQTNQGASAATVAESSPFKRYDAIENACREASERTEKLHEYLAQPSGEQAAQQQAEPGADERAAFEKYAASNFYNCTCDIYGGYVYQTARTAWAAWQARAAQSGQRAGVADEVIERLALKHIAPHAKKFFPEADYKASEQFRRVKAYTLELLSKAK